MHVLFMVPLTKQQRAALIAAARERIEKPKRAREDKKARQAKIRKRGAA